MALAQKPPSGPVPERIERIRDVQSQISEVLGHLEGRLECICPSEPEPSGPANEKDTGPTCQMEERLIDIERRAMGQRDRLVSVMRRLKL